MDTLFRQAKNAAFQAYAAKEQALVAAERALKAKEAAGEDDEKEFQEFCRAMDARHEAEMAWRHACEL